MTIEEKIQMFGTEKNILIGICDAEPMNYIEKYIVDTKFVNFEKEKRITPRVTMENCKSIIVVGLPYGKFENFTLDNEIRGKFSIGAVFTDYHIIIRNILNELETYLKTTNTFEYKIFVDTGPLIERELAKKAGLGYQGKNLSIISEKFGSYFFIGYMLVDFKMKCSKSIPFDFSNCKGCDLCIKACPTKALKGDYTFNMDVCISYLTQKKEDIEDNLKKKMGNSLYGCDICQNVCPKNKNVKQENINDINIIRPKLETFLELSNKQFKNIYGETAIYWRGKKTIQRNAIIAMENEFYKK